GAAFGVDGRVRLLRRAADRVARGVPSVREAPRASGPPGPRPTAGARGSCRAVRDPCRPARAGGARACARNRGERDRDDAGRCPCRGRRVGARARARLAHLRGADGPQCAEVPYPPRHGRAMSDDRLVIRLKRLDQQIRAFRELHTREIADFATRLDAIGKLQADELQLILDQLAAILADLAPSDTTIADRSTNDPAAASPKRAKWLAEQE